MASEVVEAAEKILGQTLLSSNHSIVLGGSTQWQRLPHTPVSSIHAPRGVDIDIDSRGDGWVRGPGHAVEVRYVAGMADNVEQLPEPIKHALLRGENDNAFLALLRPYRRVRFS
jgi:hypothetical protein